MIVRRLSMNLKEAIFTKENNGLAVVEDGYEDVSPIYHCSC